VTVRTAPCSTQGYPTSPDLGVSRAARGTVIDFKREERVTSAMVSFLLDTHCLMAAAHHPANFYYNKAAAQLIEAGRAGRVRLLAVTRVEYDLEMASPDLFTGRHKWLSERPFIQRVPGAYMLGVSRPEWGDTALSDSQMVTLDELAMIVGRSVSPRCVALHHLGAALLAQVDAVVTIDGYAMFKKRDPMGRSLEDIATLIRNACGLEVIDPETALSRVDSGESDPAV
jgi:hypothetical protein